MLEKIGEMREGLTRCSQCGSMATHFETNTPLCDECFNSGKDGIEEEAEDDIAKKLEDK
jgi:hypothetical protein